MSLQDELDALKTDSVLAYQFVINRATGDNTRLALDKINRTNAWLSRYTDRAYLIDLSDRLRADTATRALEMLKASAYKAVNQLIADLDHRDAKVRQIAYRDLLDRVGVRVPDKKQIELVAPAAVRVLEDVLLQVYGDDDKPQLSAGDSMTADYIDGEIIDDGLGG